jgi:hypothetical protein
MILARHVARMGENRNASRILMGESGRKSPVGRPRCRRLIIIKMDIEEIG